MIKNTNGETELISLAEFQGFLFDKIVSCEQFFHQFNPLGLFVAVGAL